MKYPIFAQNIRYLRRGRGLSREQFSALTGMSVSRVMLIECGDEPNAHEIKMICAVLEVGEAYLRTEDPQIAAKRGCNFRLDDI